MMKAGEEYRTIPTRHLEEPLFLAVTPHMRAVSFVCKSLNYLTCTLLTVVFKIIAQAPRDDAMSLLYVLIWMHNGRLPWCDRDDDDVFSVIKEKKLKTPGAALLA